MRENCHCRSQIAAMPLPYGKAEVIVSSRSATRSEPSRPFLPQPRIEFADKGLAGARVDTIAEQAGANKRMLYYYFGSKEGLYIAVLERAYGAMRKSERELNLVDLEPLDAIRKLAEFKFDYYLAHPAIIQLLAGENMQNAKFLKRSRRLRDMHNLSRQRPANRACGRKEEGFDQSRHRSAATLYLNCGAELFLL